MLVPFTGKFDDDPIKNNVHKTFSVITYGTIVGAQGQVTSILWQELAGLGTRSRFHVCPGYVTCMFHKDLIENEGTFVSRTLFRRSMSRTTEVNNWISQGYPQI